MWQKWSSITMLWIATQNAFANQNYTAAHGHFAEKGWTMETMIVVAIFVIPVLAILVNTIVSYVRDSIHANLHKNKHF